jgi:hypothetical protein
LQCLHGFDLAVPVLWWPEHDWKNFDGHMRGQIVLHLMRKYLVTNAEPWA